MNAKQEFITHTNARKIKCACLFDERDYSFRIEIVLKTNFSISDYIDFLKQLDFEYDNGYGGQELHGIIWYDDGTWSSRGEYDGSEWWEYNQCPEIYSQCV